MPKRHIKRIAAPKSWPIKRKARVFTVRPLPGAHSIKFGIPINTILKDMLGIASTTKEIRKILHTKEITVNKKRIKNYNYMVGLFDVVGVNPADNYRMLLNTNGRFVTLKITDKEADLVPYKIKSRKMLKGAVTQLSTSAGWTLKVEKTKDTYAIGDTIIVKHPKKEIVEHIKMDKGCIIYMTSGTHIGTTGKLLQTKGLDITFTGADKKEEKVYETLKQYAFVVGKEKPAIHLTE